MLLSWRIRYLDARDKKFGDRDLWLDTSTLDPATKAAVEMCEAISSSGERHGMLRHRRLFKEDRLSPAEFHELAIRCGQLSSFCIPDYLEDEHGKALDPNQLAAILTGNPDAVSLPAGAKQHDIEFVLSNKRPIPIDQISFSQEKLDVLGYFQRDLKEMLASAFFKEGPGTLASSATGAWDVRTAVSDEEIRSFVTIFRRMYMKKEPANFADAMNVFADAASGYPLADWVKGAVAEYAKELTEPPDVLPVGGSSVTFSRKRLIDVFLYTQYAHQPDSKRARQYQECLAEVGGRTGLLTWMFLTEMWHSAIHIRNCGMVVVGFYDQYCAHQNVAGSVLASVSDNNPGIGALEKKSARQQRIRREKLEELAEALWRERGCPPCGVAGFLGQAEADLTNAANLRLPSESRDETVPGESEKTSSSG